MIDVIKKARGEAAKIKVGSYVRVDTSRGSFTGTVTNIASELIYVQCQCCFASKPCLPKEVTLA